MMKEALCRKLTLLSLPGKQRPIEALPALYEHLLRSRRKNASRRRVYVHRQSARLQLKMRLIWRSIPSCCLRIMT